MSIFNSSQEAQSHSDQQLQYAQFQQQPQNSPIEASAPSDEYHFPTHRLRAQQSPNRTPLVLVVCGSFSPITIMHLRMCEMASDWVRMVEDNYEVVGIYLSPVSDAYKKSNLAAAHHRIRMCQLAVQDTTNCVMVDPWEARQPRYVPTAQVLDHFRHEINNTLGGIESIESPERRQARVALLCGADLMHSMSTPGLWSPDDLDRILGGEGGLYVVERHGTDLEEAKEALSRWAEHISVIPQVVPIDLSSTKVRLFLHKKMSVRYFVPNPVIEYILENNLYGTTKEDQDNYIQLVNGKVAYSSDLA
ncbi:Nicotinamide/nicotinic acid mononucleotide adenylyltransferase 1 [Sporothrix epigloea]|uniref:Nicotinamide-nucleotide adenylyltransferase n=1 Tax=Sporothrix epigloea TaxID=1892477 RepID=A0ABP0DI71_9PEZI